MKSTDLQMFYSLGVAIERLSEQMVVGKKGMDVLSYLFEPNNFLMAFDYHAEDTILKESRRHAEYLRKFVNQIFRSIQTDTNLTITQEEVQMFIGGKERFEAEFARECRTLDVFTVTKKGIYDTHLLMESPEDEIPSQLQQFLPEQTIADLKQAGKCLAFEVPTACVFHVCRGTEALILSYYAALAKHPWTKTKKDWKIYIEQLGVEGAPKSITTRLDEIRSMDRNAYTHPDKTVSLDEAPVIFRLCTAVNFYMCKEVEKLK